MWTLPIRLDSKWKNGDYYGSEEATQGVAQALKIVTLEATSFAWEDAKYDHKWSTSGRNLGESINTQSAIEEALDKAGIARAKVTYAIDDIHD